MSDLQEDAERAYRVKQAIQMAFKRQQIEPWGGMNFSGVNPPVDWDAITNEAIDAMSKPVEPIKPTTRQKAEQAINDVKITFNSVDGRLYRVCDPMSTETRGALVDAVLDAIREPSEDIIQEGANTAGNDWRARETLAAMINAIKEGA